MLLSEDRIARETQSYNKTYCFIPESV